MSRVGSVPKCGGCSHARADSGDACRLGLSGRIAARFHNTEIHPAADPGGPAAGLFAILVTPREEAPQINVTFHALSDTELCALAMGCTTPAVTIAVAKKEVENAVDIAARVEQRIAQLEGTFIPDDVEVSIAALLPMVFVTGLMGPYMSPIPINASMGMLISLVVAFVFTPWMSNFMLGKRHDAVATAGATAGTAGEGAHDPHHGDHHEGGG